MSVAMRLCESAILPTKSELLSHTASGAKKRAMVLLVMAFGLSMGQVLNTMPYREQKLAATPPRGWRSWIAFMHDADQVKMEAAIDALHKKRSVAHGNKTQMVSLQDLGYSDAGLDGGWARCEGINGSYHDITGQVLINTTKFPSLAAMNARAHSFGLTSSWYLNCDQCVKTETLIESPITDAWYTEDAIRAARLNFDGIKFDTQPGGPNWNISKWAEAIDAAGKAMVVEDCLDKHPDGTPIHDGKPSDWIHPTIDILHDPQYCPFSFYRTGGDNSPRFYHGMEHTLVDLAPFLNNSGSGSVPASRPGCWAYPDMLSIGKSVMQQSFEQRGCPALTATEEQTLFANWAIVSSPLILSFDVTNDTEVQRLWPIISNTRALSINAQWAGEAGRLLKTSPGNFSAPMCQGTDKKPKQLSLPTWAVWSKRLTEPRNGLAILAINVAEVPRTIEVSYDELTQAGVGKGVLSVTDVWTGREDGRVKVGDSWKIELREPHSSLFKIFAPEQ